MQDRYRQLDEILLRRTAGPYIWVNRVASATFAVGPLGPQHSPSKLTWQTFSLVPIPDFGDLFRTGGSVGSLGWPPLKFTLRSRLRALP